MLLLIKNRFSNKANKKLLENIIALSFLQFLNYILPLITFPYLIRVLGVEQFGLFTLIISTITYFKIIHLTNIVIILNKTNHSLNII